MKKLKIKIEYNLSVLLSQLLQIFATGDPITTPSEGVLICRIIAQDLAIQLYKKSLNKKDFSINIKEYQLRIILMVLTSSQKANITDDTYSNHLIRVGVTQFDKILKGCSQ